MPVARQGTNAGKAGNGNSRQPVPATATGGVKEKSKQSDSMDGKEKGDAGDAKAQLSEKPREELNEKQDASMASGELPDNAEKRDAQSQATSADNDTKAAEKDMSLLEKDKRASEAGQSSLSEGNGVGLGNNAGDNDPASSPAAEAHAIHEAATAAAVEHSTAIVSTATIPDPNDPARDEDEDVIMRDVNEDPAAAEKGEKKSDDEPDDATAMALDEAVTSPTPVIPPSDEVEPVQGETLGQAHGKHHPPPPPPVEDLGEAMTVEPNVSTYPVSEHEDDGDTSSEDIITQHAQQQAPLPPPPGAGMFSSYMVWISGDCMHRNSQPQHSV
ncbi:hypothetical protein KEM55_000587 [Ascosphaera atra]|nr:hypothetical protein KEM55_000587 [Ascosphaera atra]